MSPRVRELVDFAARTGLGGRRMSYQEAVDLGRVAEWWRSVALHLFETCREELRQYDPFEGGGLLDPLSDAEMDAAEHPEHEERCGDS